MTWITFPKDIRASAKNQGKSLLAAGYEGKAGRNEFCGPCDDRTAQIVFMLALKLHTGSSLDEAVAEVKTAISNFDARQAAKADD